VIHCRNEWIARLVARVYLGKGQAEAGALFILAAIPTGEY
jgi:hypothetical protein